MRPGGRARRAHAAAVLGAALLLPATASSDDSPAPDRATREPDRTALLVFVAYRGNLPVPIHPTQVRVNTSLLLASALTDRGGRVITVPDLEPMMRRWRLRSERDLRDAFLEDLAHELSARELVVAKLVTYDDRILILGRALSTERGCLLWANVTEEVGGHDLWADEAGAEERLDALVERAGRRLVSAEPVAARTDTLRALVTLPPTSSGLGRGDTDLAMICLLRSLLSTGHWQVPEPALVVDQMQRSGFDPYLLPAAARRQLAEGFASPRLLVPRLAAFPSSQKSFGAVPVVEDPDGLPRGIEARQLPVLFTLALVDGASGRLLSAGGRYLEPDQPSGLFGRTRSRPLSHRYEEGTGSLVRSLLDDEGRS